MDRLERSLPPLLSVIAGMVDVIGFVSLDHLFTAHITGNLVVISALLVRGGPPNVAQILAVPVFIVAVAAVRLIARKSGRTGPPLIQLLLVVHFLLLTVAVVISVSRAPGSTSKTIACFIALAAVAAMACQFALLRLAIPGAPSTSVMTGNLTNAVLSAIDATSAPEPQKEQARLRLARTAKLLAGFLAGCIAGAAADPILGHWSWALPAALSGIALLTTRRGVTPSAPRA
jgi:uncharacterized membrane protein YoaK (UPF0700 family)